MRAMHMEQLNEERESKKINEERVNELTFANSRLADELKETKNEFFILKERYDTEIVQ